MANIQKQLIIYHLSLIIVLSALYNCRFPTTNVMKVRQIHPFLQNEPNFRKSQMNVTKEMKKDYEKKDTWWSGKNEPKTNPIRTQTNPIKANLNPKRTQYEPKQSQFQRQKNARCKTAGLAAGSGQSKNIRMLTSLRGYGKCTK